MEAKVMMVILGYAVVIAALFLISTVVVLRYERHVAIQKKVARRERQKRMAKYNKEWRNH